MAVKSNITPDVASVLATVCAALGIPVPADTPAVAVKPAAIKSPGKPRKGSAASATSTQAAVKPAARKPAVKPATGNTRTLRPSQVGAKPSGQLLWAAFDCGALTLPDGCEDAWDLNVLIAAAQGIPTEVSA